MRRNARPNTDLAARVDARREHWYQRARAAKAKGRAPQSASGRYLLSGGLLLCPTCGGHFEVFKAPWKSEGIYVCATRRRTPGTCTNTLVLPVPRTDNAVLDMVEGEVLGTRFFEELLTLVDRGEADNTAQLRAERDRLQRELKNLSESIALGTITNEEAAASIQPRRAELARIETTLRQPRPVQPKIEELRAALEQRAAEWRETLRAEPKVARMLLRRLIGPLTLWNDAEPSAEWLEWETSVTPALLEGLAPVQVLASPTGRDPFNMVGSVLFRAA